MPHTRRDKKKFVFGIHINQNASMPSLVCANDFWAIKLDSEKKLNIKSGATFPFMLAAGGTFVTVCSVW